MLCAKKSFLQKIKNKSKPFDFKGFAFVLPYLNKKRKKNITFV
jgi:hypothetical protein